VIRKNVFRPIALNFLLAGPYSKHTILRPQLPLPIALVVWGLLPP